MPNPGDYTIGWVCAIALEKVAAEVFLDEEHELPDLRPDGDNNHYTLGRLGKHNVVIAVLPDGEYGTASAATVVQDMIRSFPNLRAGLMVGIGGGAPAKHDIRLGDIVVSSPRNGDGGVFQYDFEKTMQGGTFHHTGVLRMPPTFMRTAVSGLRTKHMKRGHGLQESIANVLEAFPRLKKKFQRPAISTDRLYKPDVIHTAQNGDSCLSSCGDCQSKLVLRSARSADDDDPAIHYGLIASANQLMKDATTRDKLSKEKDVLCFEMEAAGLMNQCPFLVIRGVCDYSDTHKNELWQGYAALTAAVYAKDLLNEIAAEKVQAEQRLCELLKNVQQDVREVQDGNQPMKIATESLDMAKQIETAHKWLGAPDPSTKLNKALRNRHASSGQWFLGHEAYSRWKSDRNSFLWLHGLAGCGKTALASIIIEDLTTISSHDVLYFYFDYSDRRLFRSMIPSLIRQLYDKNENIRGHLDQLCESDRARGSLDTHCAIFRDMLHAVQKTKDVCIVIDAIDECEGRTGDLLPWIRSLQESQLNTHILLISRQEPDIEAAIKRWASDRNIITMNTSEDIKAYVRWKVREDTEGAFSKRWSRRPDIQSEIEDALIEKAGGVFQWVACQLDELAECVSPHEVREALASLPETLNDTYSRIISKIPARRRESTLRLLQFMVYSKRSECSLKVSEAIDIIAVDTKNSTFDRNQRMPDETEIAGYLFGLIRIIPGTTGPWLVFAHFSVEEFLVSTIFKDAEDVEASIAKVCLIYLLHLDGKDVKPRMIPLAYPLSTYAARFWTYHAVAAKSKSASLDKLTLALITDPTAFGRYRRLYSRERLFVSTHKEVPTALYYAASTGLERIVEILLEQGADVNEQQGQYCTALHAASEKGHESIFQTLLDRGADVNAQGGPYGTALQAASMSGSESIVNTLLAQGVDINIKGGYYGTALQAASYKGHDTIVKTLLDQGADVNIVGGGDGTALLAASAQGHNEIVKLLLAHGANVHVQDSLGHTALQAATQERHKTIVKLLLAHGADVNSGGRHSTALQYASRSGHEGILKILLAHGAGVNPKSEHDVSALHAASIRGHENIVRILLAHGADVNVQDKSGTALRDASAHGHESIVKILLDQGADVNIRGEKGTALYAASEKGRNNIVKILLSRGADVNAIGGRYCTALQVASAEGYKSVVATLLAHGADMNIQGPNPLYCASFYGRNSVVELLLSRGADVNTLRYNYHTPLQVASAQGHESVVKTLLAHGADVNIQEGEHQTALQAAASEGHKNIVKILLDYGAQSSVPSMPDHDWVEVASKRYLEKRSGR